VKSRCRDLDDWPRDPLCPDRQIWIGKVRRPPHGATDVGMKFFLYEIVARIVAIYLCIDSGRQLWNGLAERKIAIFNPDPVNWILDSLARLPWVVRRDDKPVQYWIQMGIHTTLLVSCFIVAIFGWFHPNS
jgi:hypothetical protein